MDHTAEGHVIPRTAESLNWINALCSSILTVVRRRQNRHAFGSELAFAFSSKGAGPKNVLSLHIFE